MTLNLIHRVLGRITAVTMVFSIDVVSEILLAGPQRIRTAMMFFCDQARIQPRVTGFPMTPPMM